MKNILVLISALLIASQASAVGNMLYNGEFSAGTEGWKLELHQQATADFRVEQSDATSGGVAVLEIQTQGTTASDGWHVQFYQPGLYLEAGRTYLLKFRMESSPVVGCHVGLFHAEAPFSKVADGHYVNLGGGSLDFAFELKVTESTANGRLLFTGLNQSGVTYALTDVSLVPVAE